jgi:cell division protein ZapA
MGELSIKIKIVDREYPMRVSPSEEEGLRLAGKLLNEKFKFFKDQFGIDDKQDLLAMIAFDCLVEKMKLEKDDSKVSSSVSDKLDQLETLLSTAFLKE